MTHSNTVGSTIYQKIKDDIILWQITTFNKIEVR